MILLTILCATLVAANGGHGGGSNSSTTSSLCPVQPDALVKGQGWNPAADESYARAAAQRLSRAVQFPTVSYDNMPLNPNDTVFDSHTRFAEFLRQEFPTVYEHTTHEAVNVHSHLFTFGGTNSMANGANMTKAPILFMSHEDVVPVLNETVGQWLYPPFSGFVSNETEGPWIWGRGSSDTKNTLIGQLAAIERLIAEGFEPDRPVLISIGFDEEVGGARGASKVAEIIQQRYGTHGVAFVVDEGFSGVRDVYGTRVASLGMAEKGSVSVQLSLSTRGGHSSSPLPHTGIGLMSLLLSNFESNPYPDRLEEGNPFLKYLVCLAEHAANIPDDLKSRIQDPSQWQGLANELGRQDRIANAFLATTTAIDLISGGHKINALPESVNASINHRIAFTSSVQETAEHYVDVMVPYAQSLNISVTAFGQEYPLNYTAHDTPVSELTGGTGTPTPAGNLTISYVGYDGGLEPAPVTPDSGPSFKLLASTIKAVWGNDTLVTPTGMYANTDTAHMWNVTENIFRYTPAYLNESLNQHTVNERISLRAHLSSIQFYYQVIRNLEGWDDAA